MMQLTRETGNGSGGELTSGGVDDAGVCKQTVLRLSILSTLMLLIVTSPALRGKCSVTA